MEELRALTLEDLFSDLRLGLLVALRCSGEGAAAKDDVEAKGRFNETMATMPILQLIGSLGEFWVHLCKAESGFLREGGELFEEEDAFACITKGFEGL